MSEERIIELETKIAYQEDLLQDLNKLVATQQCQLDNLTTICNMLRDQLKEVMQSIPGEENIDAKPPHY